MSSTGLTTTLPGDQSVRTLLVVFGDQLMHDHPGLAGLDPERDAVCMMEVDAETEEGPSHKARTALFFAAMRHYACELQEKGHRVRYTTIDDPKNRHSFAEELSRAVHTHHPERLVVMFPGDARVLEEMESWESRFTGAGVREVVVLDDPHFFTTPGDFAEWAEGRKSLTMEYWYRERRKASGYLMERSGGKQQPIGGEWNYDKDNREAFKSEPGIKRPYRAKPTDTLRDVIRTVNERFPDAPGELSEDSFIWPVTREQALRALNDFIEHRLADFGTFEDAMWTEQHFLFHSVLSACLNMHLLDPRECCDKAIAAYEDGKAPLNSVEGFVRQLIGWREYIRGVYWYEMRSDRPDYRERNFLDQHGDLPEFYWSGETDMNCLKHCLRPVIEHAYSHHIPRLMVLANFAMTSGVHPRAIGDWFYGMYADSIDWATTPNTIGMGMHSDGVRKTGKHGNAAGVETWPIVGTKPYASSGKYISRMSNYCKGCRYDLNSRTGDPEDDSPPCPFNVFYWDFLIRNHDLFENNNRMAMVLKNVDRLKKKERTQITVSAKRYREHLGIGEITPN